MLSRPYVLVVVAFWLVMMSWLVAAKILPLIREGERPSYQQELIAAEGAAVRVSGWKLFWNERPIGVTVLEATHPEGQMPQVRSVARFQNLSLQRLLEDTIGGAAWLWTSMTDAAELKFGLTIATRISYDELGQLDHFDATLKMLDDGGLVGDDVRPGSDLLYVSGQALESSRIRIDMRQANGIPIPKALMPLGNDLKIQPDAEFATMMTPRSTLKGLRVGQRWNVPVVNPLSAGSAVRMVEALVEAKEEVAWHANEPLLLVVYREDRTSAPGSAAVVGRSWVTPGGEILRQEAMMGGLTIRMDRLEGEELDAAARLLEPKRFDALLAPTPRAPSIESSGNSRSP